MAPIYLSSILILTSRPRLGLLRCASVYSYFLLYFTNIIIIIIIIFINYAHRLRIFENRIPRRIFGPKRYQNGEWRTLRYEELHSLYVSSNIMIKSGRWAGHVARMEKGGSEFKMLTGNPTR